MNSNLIRNDYLVNFNQCTKEIGAEIAKEKDIEMTDKHRQVISCLQKKHNNEEALSIRGIKKSGVVNIKEFYSLFPGGPLKISTMVAGIPKPKSCI